MAVVDHQEWLHSSKIFPRVSLSHQILSWRTWYCTNEYSVQEQRINTVVRSRQDKGENCDVAYSERVTCR